MKTKSALTMLDELRKFKVWLPDKWTAMFLEDVDFKVRISREVPSKKQMAKLSDVYARALEVEAAHAV